MNKSSLFFLFLSFLLLTFLLFSCHTQNGNETPEEEHETEITGIQWDAATMKRLAPLGAYPRLYRLADKSLAAVYEDKQGHIVFKTSTDEGGSWTSPVVVFTTFKADNGNAICDVEMANPEIVQLKNGAILMACNYRPTADGVTPFAIAVKKSTDNGKTWSEAKVVYSAGERWGDGCWEPYMLQLPSGELHIYFANEGPYTHSNEQEISLLRSSDNGDTWGQFTTVSFYAGSRDGMPVARVIGNEIVVVIEDNHYVTFKPALVRTSLSNNWSSPVLNSSPSRTYAIVDQISENVYIGAPYLVVLPAGETIISYQTDEGHPGKNTIETAIGDKTARNFSLRSRPFASSSLRGEWASIIVLDANTVAVAASMSDGSIWMVKGKIVR